MKFSHTIKTKLNQWRASMSNRLSSLNHPQHHHPHHHLHRKPIIDETHFSQQWQKLKTYMTTRFKLDIHLGRGYILSFPYSFSDLAGHGSFLFLALSYMESDFLYLRLYAISGITLSIIFQYFRALPLWIPIRWNSLFLTINAVMIGLLLKEQYDANNIPEEQKNLYRSIFKIKGMKPVDYLHFISRAKRIELKKGDKIVDETKKNRHVYLVQKGSLSVLKSNQVVGKIFEHQFVGAMSFLSWTDKIERNTIEEQNQAKTWSDTFFSGITDEEMSKTILSTIESSDHIILPIALSKPVLQVSETIDPLADIHPTESILFSNAASTSHTLDKPTSSEPSTLMNQANAMSETMALAASLPPLLAPASDGLQGRADVICEEDCVVYSWSFTDLHELMKHNSQLALVIEKSISEDLNKKMSTSWDSEIKLRYKQLLLGVILDGQVNEREKLMLEKFRITYHVSLDDHEGMLLELGWNKRDFEAGFKGAPSAEILDNYRRMLKKALISFELSDDNRYLLRQFRIKHSIPSDTHLSLIKSMGWNLDEYEAGYKTVLTTEYKKNKSMKDNQHNKTNQLNHNNNNNSPHKDSSGPLLTTLNSISTMPTPSQSVAWYEQRPVLNWIINALYYSTDPSN